MDKINDLYQKRSKLVAEQRSLVDKAEAENRALVAEEKNEFERMETDLNELEGRISILKTQRERERSLADSETRTVESHREDDAEMPEIEQRAYREALNKYMRKGDRGLSQEEHRALVVGTDSAGGYLVPGAFRSTLVEALEQESAIRRFATVLTTQQGNEILVPKVTTHGAAEWVAEGGDKPVTDEVFDQVALNAHKAARIIKVSTELLEDSGFDLEGYVARELGRSIGRLEAAAYATGAANSTTTPKGLVTSATVGKTAASATAVTADEILDLVYSVSRPYRTNARFLMTDAMVAIVRKLKANSEYIFTDSGTGNSITGGEPARL